jgi:hypothetical protein
MMRRWGPRLLALGINDLRKNGERCSVKGCRGIGFCLGMVRLLIFWGWEVFNDCFNFLCGFGVWVL